MFTTLELSFCFRPWKVAHVSARHLYNRLGYAIRSWWKSNRIHSDATTTPMESRSASSVSVPSGSSHSGVSRLRISTTKCCPIGTNWSINWLITNLSMTSHCSAMILNCKFLVYIFSPIFVYIFDSVDTRVNTIRLCTKFLVRTISIRKFSVQTKGIGIHWWWYS